MASYRAAVQVAVVASSLVLSVTACRKDAPSPSSESAPAAAPKAAAANTPRRDEPSLSPKADISRLEKAAALVGLADGLPDLKPIIDKPFPAGATEQQVCEAIANTGEKDLWVRFGHLIPMYLRGSVFIVQAKKSDTEALDKVVADDGAYAEYKNCNDEKTLIFSHSMMDVTREMQRNGEVTGIPRFIKKFSDIGIKTLESFSFCGTQEQHDACQERLSDYCRADAELCESLVKLDAMNKGTGSCPHAVVRCGNRVPESKEDEKIASCIKLGSHKVSCVQVIKSAAERDECDHVIEALLCPE